MIVFKKALIFSLCALSFPLFVFAAPVLGGFPSGSIWLSKTALTDGDSTEIYTAVYDADSGKTESDVVFFVDDALIGSVHVALAPGETKIASIAWSAKQGTHSFYAEMQNTIDPDSKEPVSFSGGKTGKISVTVAAAPPPTGTAKVLASAENALSSVVAPVYAATEGLRIKAVVSLQQSLGEKPAPAASQGEVLGATTFKDPGSVLAAAGKAPSANSFMRLLKQLALAIVSYQWVFYPLVLTTILALFYILGRTVRRPV